MDKLSAVKRGLLGPAAGTVITIPVSDLLTARAATIHGR